MNTKYREIFKQIKVLIAALIGALLIGVIFLVLAKSDPVKAYTSMFTGPINDKYGITETLVRSVPLLLVGLGIIISFRSGMINIGAEGQMLAGAIGAAAVVATFSELLNICGRIAVLYDGRIMNVLPGEEADEHTLGRLMAGLSEVAS